MRKSFSFILVFFLVLTFSYQAMARAVRTNSNNVWTGKNTFTQAVTFLDNTFDVTGAITLDEGLTIDNIVDNTLEFNENDEEFIWTFGTDEIALSSTSGVVEISLFDNSADVTLSHATNGAADDFYLTLTGATNSSLFISSTGTGADALGLSTSAGGIDITVAGSAAGEDLDLLSASSINITATEDSADDAIVINVSGAGSGMRITSLADIDITTTGADGEDISVTNTGGSVIITATEAVEDAVVISASTAAGGIDITSNADLDITTTGASDEDITILNTGGSVIIEATEAKADAIILNASTALGGIDIKSNHDIDITTAGASGEDISVINTGGSVWIEATEAEEDAVTIKATTAAGGIDISSQADIDITTVGVSGEDISIVNTGGSVIVQATESANDAVILEATAGGVDILASGAADGEDIDIVATGSSVNITSTQAVANAIVLSASTALGGIDITSNADIDITTTGTTDEDITITNTGGSINLSATEDIATAIVIGASAGGIDITADGDDAKDLDLACTHGSINFTAGQSAVDSIVITSSIGGIDILAAGAAAGEDIDIVATGSSVNITSTEAGVADAIKLSASGTGAFANVIDITTTNGGITIDANNASNGDILIDAADVLTITTPDPIIINGDATSSMVFEGTANDFEATVTITDPTTDNAIVLPDYSGGVPLIIAQGYTQTAQGEAATIDVTGGGITLADGWFIEGKTLKFVVGGVVTGANDTVSVLLYFEDAAVMTLTTTDGAEGDWQAEFTIIATAAATQRIFGKLVAEGGTEVIVDYATDATDTASAGTIPIKLQIAEANGTDEITTEYVQIWYWNQAD